MNATLLKRQPQIIQLKVYYSNLTWEQRDQVRRDFLKGEIIATTDDEYEMMSLTMIR